MSRLLFSSIDVSRQVFYRTPLAFAIVNLKPLVPGRESKLILLESKDEMSSTDVLVIPTRVVHRLADLQLSELSELMSSVQHVGKTIERVYDADALTIACQVSFRILLRI